MSLDVNSVVLALQHSMSPNPSEIKTAEAQLTQAEMQLSGSFLSMLLGIVFGGSQGLPIRQSASILAKNMLRRRWGEELALGVHGAVLSEVEKVSVRAFLVDATCGPNAVSLPRQIQTQVNAIISYIADVDFPAKWPDLLPALVSTLNRSETSGEVRLNALNCVCSIFRKYKTVARSNSVLLELKYLLPLFQQSHLQLFRSLLPSVLSAPTTDQTQLLPALDQILEIFYSLNVVDIPEFYQDNVGEWINGFLQLLALPSVVSRSDDPSPLDVTKALVCENLSLYADKYQEVFEPFVANSVRVVWTMLVQITCGDNSATNLTVSSCCNQFDQLVSAGIHFLSAVANTKWPNSPFEQSEALVQICEKLILPNIQLRDADIELFTDNPDEYIRRDLQSADSDTRRRSSVDLVKSLSKFYEEKVTEILLNYVSNFLRNYSSNVRAKDACIQLIAAIGAKGETRTQGVSVVNPKVDINQFFANQMMDVLRTTGSTQKISEEQSVLQASVLKFLILFRSQIQESLVEQSLALVLSLVRVDSQKVVQSYAAHCAFLLIGGRMKGLPSLEAFAKNPLLPSTIENTIRVIASNGAADQNEYIIKLLFKLLEVQVSLGSTENKCAFSFTVLHKLVEFMTVFSSNPAVNANFTHYMFESIGLVVAATLVNKNSTDDNYAKVHSITVGPLCQLLEKNVNEYIPYALQILALLIESAGVSSNNPPGDVFGHLFTLLLNEELWKNPSLIFGIGRIFEAYLFRAGDVYANLVTGNIDVLVSRISLLIGTSKYEQVGFDLLNALFARPSSVPPNVIKSLFMVLLTKIHNKKSDKLVKLFAVSLSILLFTTSDLKLGVLNLLDNIQPGLSTQVIKDLWMNAIGSMSVGAMSVKNKKVVIGAVAKVVDCLASSHQATDPVLTAVLIGTQNMLVTNSSIDPSTIGVGGTSSSLDQSDQSADFEVSYAKLSSTVNHAVENDFVPQLAIDSVGLLKAALSKVGAASHIAPQLTQWARY